MNAVSFRNRAIRSAFGSLQHMTESSKPGRKGPLKSADAATAANPEWADGLKRLYDSVVDEPLPDAFMDLLSKLDEGKS